MELYNKSKRGFTVAHPKADDVNKGIQHIKPEEKFTVSEEEGAKLLELYPKEILKLSDAESELKDANELLDETLAENEALKKELAELKAKKQAKKSQ